MRQRLEKALRTIAALPEDGWEPYTWDEFLSARAVIVDELGRMDRAASAGTAAKRRTQARTSIPGAIREQVAKRSGFMPALARHYADTNGTETATTNERGFVEMAKVPCRTGGYVQVRETSLATEASFWLDAAEPLDLNDAAVAIATGTPPETVPHHVATVQLSSAGARALRDQLDGALARHRFGDLRADGDDGLVTHTLGSDGRTLYRLTYEVDQ